MSERSLVSFTLGLTPSEESAQPTLNPGQQKELLGISRMYAGKVGVGLSVDSLKKIGGVVGDAVFRALAEQNQPSLTPKDRLRPLFQRGLEIREDLRRKAENLHNLSSRSQHTYSDSVGPLALPASLIHAANTDQRVFALTADLEPVQQVVMMGEERLALVDTWAKMGLTALPETLRPVSLEQFPIVPATVSERVQIIRNMITSFIFRGSLSPLISTAELRDFVKKAPSFFSEEAKELLLEQMQADTPQQRSYLEALYAQTREPFRLYTAVPADDNPKGIEDFYRRYAGVLLLMHPFREEQQIITNPQKLKEGSPSLWDDPRIIEGFKLPKSDLLSQALRQAQARGDALTAEKLRAGINTWIWFEGARETHAAKIKQDEEKLAERAQLLSDMSNPDFPLPKEAYFIRYTTQSRARANALYARRTSEQLTKVIRNMLNKQKEVSSYEQSLIDQYGKDWPEVVQMPKSAFVEKLLEERKQLQNKNHVASQRLSALEELLAIDFFWNKLDKFPPGILKKNRDTARNKLTRELEATEQLLSQPDFDENLFSPEEFSAEQLRDHLAPSFRRQRALQLPNHLKPFYKFWKDIYVKAVYETTSEGGVIQNQKKLDLKKAIPEIPKLRVQLLQFALLTLEEKDQLLKQQRAAQIRLEETSDVKKPLPVEASWSQNEARSYIKEVEASKLPSLKGITLDELAKAASEMMYFINRYAAKVLPNRVMGKDALEGWLNSQINAINTLKPDVKKQRSQGYLAYFKKMLSYMDNPLIPLSGETSYEGIGKNSFLRAWQTRVDFAYAICYKSRVLKQSQEASQKYDLLMRDAFEERLRRELESRERDLDKLRSHNLEEELLEKMRTHNLVLEA